MNEQPRERRRVRCRKCKKNNEVNMARGLCGRCAGVERRAGTIGNWPKLKRLPQLKATAPIRIEERRVIPLLVAHPRLLKLWAQLEADAEEQCRTVEGQLHWLLRRHYGEFPRPAGAAAVRTVTKSPEPTRLVDWENAT